MKQKSISHAQISKDLLSESQSVVFADMVRDIVRQLKLNPNQIPVPTASRRNVDKVTKFKVFDIFVLQLHTNQNRL